MRRSQKSLMGETIAVLNRAARLPEAMQGKKVRNPVQAELARELVEAALQAGERRLSWGIVGCLSGRLGADAMLISREGTAIGSLTPQDWLKQSLRAPSSAPAASESVALHRAIYIAQPEARAILFAQPLFATLLASHERLAPPAIDEVEDFWSQAAWIPREQTSELENVAEECRSHCVLLLQSRGLLCWSGSPLGLIPLAQTVEEVAKFIWFEQTVRQR